MKIKVQALHFRALRTASTLYLRHFSKIGSGDLEKLLEEIEKERRVKEEQEEEKEEARKKEEEQASNEGDEKVIGEGEVIVEEEKKSAIKLGNDTPLRDETVDEEKEKGAVTPLKSKDFGNTPKRPREESDESLSTKTTTTTTNATTEDTEMKDDSSSSISVKKQKISD